MQPFVWLVRYYLDYITFISCANVRALRDYVHMRSTQCGLCPSARTRGRQYVYLIFFSSSFHWTCSISRYCLLFIPSFNTISFEFASTVLFITLITCLIDLSSLQWFPSRLPRLFFSCQHYGTHFAFSFKRNSNHFYRCCVAFHFFSSLCIVRRLNGSF